MFLADIGLLMNLYLANVNLSTHIGDSLLVSRFHQIQLGDDVRYLRRDWIRRLLRTVLSGARGLLLYILEAFDYFCELVSNLTHL